VNVRLKIGKMTCLEYAAMKGYADILSELMSKSVCYETLRQYFALDGRNSFCFFKVFWFLLARVIRRRHCHRNFVRLSVRLSVRHTSEPHQIGPRYRNGVCTAQHDA